MSLGIVMHSAAFGNNLANHVVEGTEMMAETNSSGFDNWRQLDLLRAIGLSKFGRNVLWLSFSLATAFVLAKCFNIKRYGRGRSAIAHLQPISF